MQPFQKLEPWAKASRIHRTYRALPRLEPRTAVVKTMVGLLWRGFTLRVTKEMSL